MLDWRSSWPHHELTCQIHRLFWSHQSSIIRWPCHASLGTTPSGCNRAPRTNSTFLSYKTCSLIWLLATWAQTNNFDYLEINLHRILWGCWSSRHWCTDLFHGLIPAGGSRDATSIPLQSNVCLGRKSAYDVLSVCNPEMHASTPLKWRYTFHELSLRE